MMKPVIIIAIAFVLLIPIPIFAQVVDFNTGQEVYYQFDMITISGVVDVDPDIPDIFIEIFSPEKQITSFTRDINPDGTFSFQLQANPDVYIIDGEYTFKITYVNAVEKTINYQKFRDIATFVDQTKNPCSYVDRYDNESGYEEWFRDNYPEYISIYEAVGIHDNQKLCNTFGMSEAEKQAREEIENPCSKIPDPERNVSGSMNSPVYMESFREAQYQYNQQMQKCFREYQILIDQRVAELEELGQKVCTAQYDPVCGISGETFSNRCVLESAGGIFDYKGECVGTEPELQRKILCGDGTVDIDGICQVEQIEEEKPVEKVDVQVEKPAKKSVNWFSSFFDWLGSLFG